MKDFFADLKVMVEEFGTAPAIENMPKRSLLDKGINGPTAAHVIEEVHSPLNFAYLTFTTGSSAFQNIVGITHAEMPQRIEAAVQALQRAGVKPKDKLLFTYPPLVNVFTRAALDQYDVTWSFLRRSSRDAFLSALYEENPDVIIGESSFLRASLEDAKTMSIVKHLPQEKIIITAGTPLDLGLLETAEETIGAKVHDLYGCQEFGWLMLDGVFLRDDLTLLQATDNKKQFEVVVGGLPMGDSFTVAKTGHVCNQEGKVITYRRRRTYPEYEVFVLATTLSSPRTVQRVARSILRIKGRVVKVVPEVKVAAPHTVLALRPAFGNLADNREFVIEGPKKTALFDDLVQAQLDYQQSSKTDPAWRKER